jgi:hypothetical protein
MSLLILDQRGKLSVIAWRIIRPIISDLTLLALATNHLVPVSKVKVKFASGVIG